MYTVIWYRPAACPACIGTPTAKRNFVRAGGTDAHAALPPPLRAAPHSNCDTNGGSCGAMGDRTAPCMRGMAWPAGALRPLLVICLVTVGLPSVVREPRVGLRFGASLSSEDVVKTRRSLRRRRRRAGARLRCARRLGCGGPRERERGLCAAGQCARVVARILAPWRLDLQSVSWEFAGGPVLWSRSGAGVW